MMILGQALRHNQLKHRQRTETHNRGELSYETCETLVFEKKPGIRKVVHETFFEDAPGVIGRTSAINDYSLSNRGLHPILPAWNSLM